MKGYTEEESTPSERQLLERGRHYEEQLQVQANQLAGRDGALKGHPRAAQGAQRTPQD
jgi:hypothetical protein